VFHIGLCDKKQIKFSEVNSCPFEWEENELKRMGGDKALLAVVLASPFFSFNKIGKFQGEFTLIERLKSICKNFIKIETQFIN